MCRHKTYYLLEIRNRETQKIILRERHWEYNVLDEDLIADAIAAGFEARYTRISREKKGWFLPNGIEN